MTYKSYDELFNAILVAYQNAGAPTVAIGSDAYIRAAGLASCIWGLYKELAWTGDQIFEASAADENVLRHAASYGILQKTGESVESLLARLQARKRRPPAGGNKYDYQNWATEVVYNGERAGKALCIPNGRGLGTSLVLVWNSDNSMISTKLVAKIYESLMEMAPVAPREIYCVSTQDMDVDLKIRMDGGSTSLAEQYIRAHVDSLAPGQILKLAFISVFCIQAGALDVYVEQPISSVDPGQYARVRISSVVWL